MPFAPLADMHTHTDSSPDSKAPIVSMCEAALRLGLPALAVTDHVEMTSFLADGYDKSSERSYRQTLEMRERYAGRLEILTGVELGEPMFDRERSARLLRGHPYDFVLGSLHNLEDGVDYFHYDYASADIGAVLDIYFRAELELVEMGGFQSLAHLTYPMRYMPEYKRPADTRRWQDVIDTLFRRMAEQGIALEINTSGLRQAIGQTSPDLPLIRRFRSWAGKTSPLVPTPTAPRTWAPAWKPRRRSRLKRGSGTSASSGRENRSISGSAEPEAGPCRSALVFCRPFVYNTTIPTILKEETPWISCSNCWTPTPG